MRKLNLLLATLILIAASCSPQANVQPPAAQVQPTATKSLEEYRFKIGESTVVAMTATAQTAVALGTPPVNCPVTAKPKVSFQAPEPFPADAPWQGSFWYGSEGLWTDLRTDGVWSGLPKNPDGYTQKIMWWSKFYVLKEELEPALVVSGRRLDGESPSLRFYGATNAMTGESGDAMLTGVEFPTLGCWEVTGNYKGTSLTFVVWLAP